MQYRSAASCSASRTPVVRRRRRIAGPGVTSVDPGRGPWCNPARWTVGVEYLVEGLVNDIDRFVALSDASCVRREVHSDGDCSASGLCRSKHLSRRGQTSRAVADPGPSAVPSGQVTSARSNPGLDPAMRADQRGDHRGAGCDTTATRAVLSRPSRRPTCGTHAMGTEGLAPMAPHRRPGPRRESPRVLQMTSRRARKRPGQRARLPDIINVGRTSPSSWTWRTFLRGHAQAWTRLSPLSSRPRPAGPRPGVCPNGLDPGQRNPELP